MRERLKCPNDRYLNILNQRERNESTTQPHPFNSPHQCMVSNWSRLLDASEGKKLAG